MTSSGCKIKRVGTTMSDATGYGRAAQDERIPRLTLRDFDSRRLHHPSLANRRQSMGERRMPSEASAKGGN